MTLKTTNHPDHERADAKVGMIWAAVTAFVITVLFVGAVVWWMYGYVRQQDQLRDVRRTLMPPAPSVPPDPRLQVDPQQDLQSYKRDQDQILNSYGWVTRAKGRVRVPIERA